jgi:hypothetical protein
MKASSSLSPVASPAHRISAALLLAAACVLVSFLSRADAQDSVTLKNGSRREGQIVGVSGGTVRIAIQSPNGIVETSVPLADVQSASMQAPSAFEDAKKLLARGNVAAGSAKLAPLVEKFLGLPVPWVQSATIALMGAQIDSGDLASAEKTLEAFNRAYPDASDLTSLLRARLAIGKGNFIGAKPLLAPIVAQGEQTKRADSQQSKLFGQAFYLMGQIREKENDLPSALQDYIRVTTLFFDDESVARKAQERVDFLTGEKKVIVP